MNSRFFASIAVSIMGPVCLRAAAPIPEQEFVTVLASRFASKPVKTFAEKVPDTAKRASTFEGEFTLTTSLSWNPTVKVVYRVPLTERKRPLPTADHMVVFCTWMGGARPDPNAIKSGLHGHMSPFSDNYGFSSFSLELETHEDDLGNKEEAYFYAGPEWMRVVLAAQDEIIKRHKLKKKKLLMYGPSMGGSFAQHLGVKLADHVAGVAIQNASTVMEPLKPSRTAWFIGVTRGDGGSDSNRRFAGQLRALGTRCVHVITPPHYDNRQGKNLAGFYHSVSEEARDAAYKFLAAVADSQGHDGYCDPNKWPFLRDIEMPLVIRRNDPTNARLVPEGRREYLPSREVVQRIQSMPVPTQTADIDSRDPGKSLCMAGIPPLGRPKGIVVIGQKYNFQDLPALIDNLNYVAEQGYLVLAPRARGTLRESVSGVIDFIARHQQLSTLPVAFIGVGDDNPVVWNLLLAERRLKPAAYVPIELTAPEVFDKQRWPIGSDVNWPLLFLYEELKYASAATSQEAKSETAELQAVKGFITRQKERNQVAAVQFVPIEKAEQAAQRNIESAVKFINATVGGSVRRDYQ